MTMTPLTTTQVPEMDEARMAFANKLNDHIIKLREELRINELILESILHSLSSQTEGMAQMNAEIHAERIAAARHRPVMLTEQGEDLLKKLGQSIVAKTNGADQS